MDGSGCNMNDEYGSSKTEVESWLSHVPAIISKLSFYPSQHCANSSGWLIGAGSVRAKLYDWTLLRLTSMYLIPTPFLLQMLSNVSRILQIFNGKQGLSSTTPPKGYGLSVSINRTVIILCFSEAVSRLTMFLVLLRAAKVFQQAIRIIFNFLAVDSSPQIASPSASAPQTMKHIVVLGGSYAGISTAHRILKQSAKMGPLKITLVSPNTHFYWSMASPRGVVPGQIADEKLFQPIAAGFSKYAAAQFECILAKAERLDVEAKTVTVSNGDTLEYDYLIVATGSRTRAHTPFKGLGTTEETRDALHDFQAEVEKAKSIVIAGAGVTGVEAAGELAFEYGREKKIVLVCPKYPIQPTLMMLRIQSCFSMRHVNPFSDR